MAAALILVAILLFLVVLFLISAIKVAREYERGIVFRLGRLLAEPKGPGLFLLIPIVDRMVKVDLRTITLNIPPQEVITKDNVPVRVNAVAYFRIVDPANAIVQVENFMVATSQIAQTTLRSVLGQHLLDELLSERDKINSILQEIIDEATAPWGIKVSIVEVKDVEIPSGHAARDGPAGGGRARAAREGDRGRGRVPGLRAAEGRRARDRGPPDRPAAALPADARRARLLAVDDDRLPGADRPADAVPRAAQGLLSPELRVDPLSGRLVAVAPGRSSRPGADAAELEPVTDEQLDSCPFCEGREERTPPELLALPRDRAPDTPGWRVRVVPNKYPAFEHQEVVVNSPQHVRSIAELDREQLELVAEAWRLRAEAAREAGQGGLRRHQRGPRRRREPAALALAARLARRRAAGRPGGAPDRAAGSATTSRRELAEGSRVVEQRDGLVLLCPYAGRAPYECLVAPLEHEADGFGPRLGAALDLAAEVLRRLAEDAPRPMNLWLHESGHWHLELLPRLTVFAALELGAGYYVNTIPPEQAAEQLRR